MLDTHKDRHAVPFNADEEQALLAFHTQTANSSVANDRDMRRIMSPMKQRDLDDLLMRWYKPVPMTYALSVAFSKEGYSLIYGSAPVNDDHPYPTVDRIEASLKYQAMNAFSAGCGLKDRRAATEVLHRDMEALMHYLEVPTIAKLWYDLNSGTVQFRRFAHVEGGWRCISRQL
jgi:hypothetical protein